ncbi:MAG: IS3 family transposase [Methylomarinum sp.]|nr:IS3 family transposase [Methylomarinum sp.]
MIMSSLNDFFGSLKHDWVLKVYQNTREHMKLDVAAYIKYYNLDWLHTSTGDISAVNYENSQITVSG